MGTLYLVATPIGNLEDISTRALRILREVQLIAAEDTRYTRKLLNYYDIRAPLTSYHEHNKLTRLEAVLTALETGDVALVSDAGTPALNDPGYELVREALAAGYTVSPIPGPSAPLAALVASGLPTDSFLYLGYLPRRHSERQRRLREVETLPYSLVVLETPHRLVESLADMQAILGERQMVVARELTKLHEEFVRGVIGEVLDHFRVQPPRGEITLVIAGKAPNQERWSTAKLEAAVDVARQMGESPTRAAARLSDVSGWPRREVYQRLVGHQADE
jgi:16S rRNA (cytidine1402-2'-O)-methyltransferase